MEEEQEENGTTNGHGEETQWPAPKREKYEIFRRVLQVDNPNETNFQELEERATEALRALKEMEEKFPDGFPEATVRKSRQRWWKREQQQGFPAPAQQRGPAKKDLLDEEKHSVFLHCVFKKTDAYGGLELSRICLPFHFRDPKTTRTILITRDNDKDQHNPDVEVDARYFQQILAERGVTEGIDEVISLRMLKRVYKTFEAKRKLLASFDVFLADRKVYSPILINLSDYVHANKSKYPFLFNFLGKGYLKPRLDKALRSTMFVTKRCMTRLSVRFGNIGQPLEELTANFNCVRARMADLIPGGWRNVRSLYLSLNKGPSLPIYASFESSNMVDLVSRRQPRPEPVEDELTTIDGRVRVYANGDIEVIDEDGNVKPNEEKFVKPKKRKMNRAGKRIQEKKRRRAELVKKEEVQQEEIPA